MRNLCGSGGCESPLHPSAQTSLRRHRIGIEAQSGTKYRRFVGWVERQNRLISDFLQLRHPSSKLVSYDQLADSPSDGFPELCRFIGMPWEETALEYWNVTHHGLGGNGAASVYLREYEVQPFDTGRRQVLSGHRESANARRRPVSTTSLAGFTTSYTQQALCPDVERKARNGLAALAIMALPTDFSSSATQRGTRPTSPTGRCLASEEPPGISMPARSLTAVAALMPLRRYEPSAGHAVCARESCATGALARHLLCYAGWPVARSAARILRKALKS